MFRRLHQLDQLMRQPRGTPRWPMFLLALAALSVFALAIVLALHERPYRNLDVWQGLYLALATSYFLVKTISEAIPLAENVRWRLKQKSEQDGRCPACGYLVEDLPRCPECGAAKDQMAKSRGRPQLSGIGPRLEYGYSILAATAILIASMVALLLPGGNIFWPAVFTAASAWYLYSKVRRKTPTQS